MRLLALVALANLTMFISACSGSGGEGEQVESVRAVSYPSAVYALAGEALSPVSPVVQGQATSFTIAPALPAGLSLASDTGVLSGTASSGLTDFAEYTVTASGGGGTAQGRFRLGVVLSAADYEVDPSAATQLALLGANPTEFNPRNATLEFVTAVGSFAPEQPFVSLRINNQDIPSSQATITATRISIPVVFDDGRNIVSFAAIDSYGAPIFHNAVIWAGSNSQTVRLTTVTGTPVTTPATLSVRLSDDPSVVVSLQTSTGSALFANVPARTVLYNATASDNRSGSLGTVGATNSVALVLLPFNPPSTIANNDISQGLAGWTASTAGVATVVPHQLSPLSTTATPLAQRGPGSGSGASALAQDRYEAHRRLSTSSALAQTDVRNDRLANVPVNNDIRLRTSGLGPQRLSRTFTVRTDTREASIRFRFVTSEVPGGYFGSQFNDYYSVSLSRVTGGNSTDTASMNSLGLGAFHFASGSTAYRTISLANLNVGDVVQVDVTVANVGDAFLDSFVDVDLIEEDPTSIRPSLTWNEAAGGLDLSFTVEGSPLAEAKTVDVFWAGSPNIGGRLGSALFSRSVSAGTGPGSYGPFHISGQSLTADPAGTTHLIAVAGTNVGSIPDARLAFGARANSAAVSSGLFDILRDALRVAGRSSAGISRTAVGPADQARAMFQNLTRGSDLAANIAAQRVIYGPFGDQVIAVFQTSTQGLTRAQVLAASQEIMATMTQSIINLGPSNVSAHCADPSVISVADVGMAAFTSASGPRFRTYAETRASRVLVENGVYHVELRAAQ